MQAAVNTEIIFEFDGGTRAKKLAEAELWSWQTRVFAGGYSSLVNNQVREAFTTGVLSIEWVPEKNRKGIREAVPVPRETVSVRRDADDVIVYEQILVGEPVQLHPLTYRYVPVETEAGALHGLPIALAAVEALDRKRSLLGAEQRIIALKEKLALVVATLPMPDHTKMGYASADDPDYGAALGTLLSTYIDLLIQTGDKYGIYAGWETEDGKPNIQSTPVDQQVTGLQEIVRGNQHRIWNALSTPPFLAGEMGSTNYALSKTVMPAFYSIADSIQRAMINQLEHGANLHLRLAGIPATAWLKFAPRASAYEEEEARAAKTRAETDSLLYKLLGESYVPTLAANWDVKVEELKKALEAKVALPEPPELPPDTDLPDNESEVIND